MLGFVDVINNIVAFCMPPTTYRSKRLHKPGLWLESRATEKMSLTCFRVHARSSWVCIGVMGREIGRWRQTLWEGKIQWCPCGGAPAARVRGRDGKGRGLIEDHVMLALIERLTRSRC